VIIGLHPVDAASDKEIVMAIKKAAKAAAKQSLEPDSAAKPKTAKKDAAKKNVSKKLAATVTAKSAQPATANATTRHRGSCHCGRIAFEVEGTIDRVMDCNCSMCQRRGGLLWFVPRSAMRLTTPESSLWTYTFNTHALKHHFCANCGIAPFSEGEKSGDKMAAINVRCIQGVDPSTLNIVKIDGRSL
jgi:hypothetical protein